MAEPVTIDLRHVARGLDVSLKQVEAVVELIDEGNTVPFITRYRKDRTGGLDEERIREIQERLTRERLLAERKQTILRSIESQGKLTEKLAKQIQGASTTKRLEDLYLPFKPKKQTLATLARSRGLDLLAQEILSGAIGKDALDARAADFANPDRQVPTAADALLGAGHILAEQFSESAELRHRLREILQRTGKIISVATQPEAKEAEPAGKSKPVESPVAEAPVESPESAVETIPSVSTEEALPASSIAEPVDEMPVAQPPIEEPVPSEVDEPLPAVPSQATIEANVEAPPASDALAGPPATSPEEEAAPPPPDSESPSEAASGEPAKPPRAPVHASAKKARPTKADIKREKKEQKKKQAEERKHKAFADYYQYSEEIRRMPPHRVLAINRGERARVLRVKLECDLDAMRLAIDEICVPAEHPHGDFLRGCALDALNRLILPSLDREIRRELTERAETHAVDVFAKNLRNLLLQPPVRDRRVLAVDPGFKNGCKLAAIDQFGNILAHDVIYLIGKPERRDEAKQKILALVEQHQLGVIAIGNGTACRQSENFVAELLSNELKDKGVVYVVVNEAGASVYSTSRLGREELPSYDATARGAVSIGRRLQDPLSELVKIDPANIGVGLYQHDVKQKHLQESLDHVVESCVNYVGVDVNTASPSLLRYVSGLNQLTARRLYEHRMTQGPFRTRQQLKEVAGVGETTFVQAAGFLKIGGGENPLDSTWIHPESYEIAARVMERLGITPADLSNKEVVATLPERIAQVDAAALAGELQVGVMTLKDILAQFARPGRDPREDLPPPVFKKGILKLEDLTVGMELTGTVLNVVDFGGFVDIGMHDSGLVHVSHMADRFVRDPHEVVAVGDVVRVWVLEVDKDRRRVSLSMLPPGHERQMPPRHPPQGRGREASQGEEPREGRPPQQGGRPPQQGGGRPQGRQGQRQGQGGPPRGNRPPDRRGQQGPPPQRIQKPPPKPLRPLTDNMKDGKEPLRTFGDLLQFYEMTHGKPQREEPRKDEGKKKDKKKDGRRDDSVVEKQPPVPETAPPAAPSEPEASPAAAAPLPPASEAGEPDAPPAAENS